MFLSSLSPSGRERVLLCFVLLLILTALVGPVLPGAAYTGLHFADSRALHHLPNAMDVLSNLPFLLLGVWGLDRLHRIKRQCRIEAPHESSDVEAQRQVLRCATVFFVGLVVTCAGSVFYHLQPDALRLGGVIACYALAKALEAGDEWVYEATRHLVSGHSLKHLAAALAALPVLHALRGWARSDVRHNPLAVAVTA